MTAFAQIAVKDLGDSVRNYQARSSGEFIIFVIVLMTIVALAIVAWWVARRRREQRRPLLLFYDLADYHEMPRQEQKQLLHLARAHGVEDPACLFVCPELLARIESLEASESGGEKERRRTTELFAGFRKAAFGDLSVVTEEAGGEE